MPSHALLSRPQTVLKRLAVSLPLRSLLAMQDREATMQLQRSALTTGGSFSEAAQSGPAVGQACGAVFVTTYADSAVLDGVAFANWIERAVKSGSLLAFPSVT